MTNTHFIEKTEEQILHFKQMTEEFALQLYLGKAEAIDELEKQKKNFRNYLDELTEVLQKPNFKEKAEKIQVVFDELQVQLALGKAETKEAIEEQKEKLFKSIQSFEKIFFSDSKNSGLDNQKENFKKNTEKLAYIIDIVRLQFALGKAEIKDEFHKNRIKLIKDIHEIKNYIKDDLSEAEKKLNLFKLNVEKSINRLLSGFNQGNP